MNSQTQELRQSIRSFKNNIIKNYYNFRINTPHTPYTVLLKPNPYKVLFILSHMRSGSSLLTHLLVSNPEIIGIGETHIQYASEADFKKLLMRLYWHEQEFRKVQDLINLRMNHQYVLDKVLHDSKFLGESFLESTNVRSIFLIREPKRTLVSMLDHKPHWTEEAALLYYTRRLATLERYAKLINSKERSIFITHEQLIKNTDTIFKNLQNFLETKESFSENYQILKTTGTRNVGDFKENIKSGRIVRESRKIDIEITSETIEKAERAFTQCYQTLSDRCWTIED
jgi:Sulfotransferase domain